MEERRMFSRIKINIPLKFLNLINDREGEAETVDISANGIGFITKEELTPSTPLRMWLILHNDHDPIHITGDVVWSNTLENNIERRVGVRLKEERPLDLAYVLSVKNIAY